jgi:intracellular sulfur oxidation DsrE/DsrF family protein
MTVFPSKHLAIAIASALVALGSHAAEPNAAPQLTIDVPVTLEQAKVVFNMDHLAFAADEPIGLMYMTLMTKKFAQDKTNWKMVAVFHGAAGYMLLNDAEYDKVRKGSHGNPYKEEIARLQQAGVQFEECGQTARTNHWVNANLLPGVKVNAGANFRLTQLVQDGYAMLQP